MLSKYLKQDERVIINIDQQPIDIVTEKGGKLKNIQQEIFSDINWKHASLVLRLPTSICDYNPKTPNMLFTVCDECTLSITGNTVQFTTSETSITRIILVQDNRSQLYLEDQDISFTVDPDKAFILYLYS